MHIDVDAISWYYIHALKNARKEKMSLRKQTVTAAKVGKMYPINRDLSKSGVFSIISLNTVIKIFEIDKHEEQIG